MLRGDPSQRLYLQVRGQRDVIDHCMIESWQQSASDDAKPIQ